MKIKSPIGFMALWSAFLAAGSWIVPLGVVSGLSIQSTSVAIVVPIEVEEVPLVVVLTTDSCAESGEDLAIKMAEQAGLQPNDSDVVRVQVSPDLAQQLAVEAVAAGGLQGENPVDGDGKALPPPLKLPPLPNGEPRSWKPVKGTAGRPIKWIPNTPLPPPQRQGAVSQAGVGILSTITSMWMMVLGTVSGSSPMARPSTIITYPCPTSLCRLGSRVSIEISPLSSTV
jgi:hypothetical protein